MYGQPTLQLAQTRSLTMTGALRQAISLLQLSNAELSARLTAQAEVNPFLVVRLSTLPVKAWLSDRAPPYPITPEMRGPQGQGDAAEMAGAISTGLWGHVLAQLPLLVRSAADHHIAEAYVAALDANGWLCRTEAEVARECGCSIDRAKAVLSALQQAEPTGLFSRNLSECLRLQAIDLGILDPAFDRLLDNLPLLAEGDLAAVAAHIGCDVDRVADMLRAIRQMNPKPGSVFAAEASPVAEPDIIVRQIGTRWVVELNRSNLAAVEVKEVDAATDELRAARWLVRAVARRNATTLRIARALVAYQVDFVTKGVSHLRPLTLADLAAQTDLHVSTISRVTNGMMVAVPRTTLMLRDFFGRAVDEEDGPTTAAIRQDILCLVAAEDPAKPLSDQQIQRHFAQKGIPLARRTVAKYRQLLRIPASAARRSKARLDCAAKGHSKRV